MLSPALGQSSLPKFFFLLEHHSALQLEILIAEKLWQNALLLSRLAWN
jgi:hypothetical protein